MAIVYGVAQSDDDLSQILMLQQANHASSVTAEKAARDGFVTVVHSFDLIKQMNAAAPQVVAKDGETVIGYALVMLKSFGEMIPVLRPLFRRLAAIPYDNKMITEHAYYVMGQICVSEQYRGLGVFDALYQKHRELHRRRYDLCVTSVSTRNTRSMRAHQRVGFQIVNTFRDQTDEWNVLAWKINNL